MKRSLFALVAILPLMLETAAQAEPILDFNMDAAHPATAQISYDGLGGPLIGVFISVDSVLGLNTPANDGLLIPITDGTLTFATGNLISTDADEWRFGPGGIITVSGDIGFGPSVLLTGTFTSGLVIHSS